MLTPQEVEAYADKIMIMVRDDIAEGVVPDSVRSFVDLHDYVDANMYLEDAGQKWTWTDDDSFNELVIETNQITDEVSRRLSV